MGNGNNWGGKNRNNQRNNQQPQKTVVIDNSNEVTMSDVKDETQDKPESAAPAVDNAGATITDTASAKAEETTVTVETPKPTEPAIDTTTVVTPGPVVGVNTPAPTEPAPTEAVTVDPSVIDELAPVSESRRIIDSINAIGNARQQLLARSLNTYVVNMDPRKRITDGWSNQARLWNAIKDAVERSVNYDEFQLAWATLLAYFDEHKEGALGDPFIWGYSHLSTFDANEFNAFQRMLNLLLTTCMSDKKLRKAALTQVDLENTLEHVWSNKAREYIQTFYAQ